MTSRTRSPGIFVRGLSPLPAERGARGARENLPVYPNAYFVELNGVFYLDTEATSGLGYVYQNGRLYIDTNAQATNRILVKPSPDGIHIVIDVP